MYSTLYSSCEISHQFLKGTLTRDYRPSVFSSNDTLGSLDSWAKAVLNIDKNWRRNSTRFDAEIDSALCRIARSLKKVLSATPRYATCVKFKSKIFLPTPRYAA
jgi:hypothetical protein